MDGQDSNDHDMVIIRILVINRIMVIIRVMVRVNDQVGNRNLGHDRAYDEEKSLFYEEATLSPDPLFFCSS